MLALERTSFRLFPLPPIYNFRRFTMTSLYNIKGPARPVITRTSVFAEAAALVEAGVLDEDAAEALSVHNTTTAVQAALQAGTDQVQQMKDRGRGTNTPATAVMLIAYIFPFVNDLEPGTPFRL